MARFFQNLKEEKSEAQAKTTQIVAEAAEPAISKNERRLKELEAKAAAVRTAKSFDKEAKKILQELKKNANLFKHGAPDFVLDLLREERFKVNKQLCEAGEELLRLLEAARASNTAENSTRATGSTRPKSTAATAQRTAAAPAQTLAAALDISDLSEREEALQQLSLASLTPGEAQAATTALFACAARRGDSVRMAATLVRFVEAAASSASAEPFSACALPPRFLQSLDGLLEKIVAAVYKEGASGEFNKVYGRLLSLLKDWEGAAFRSAEHRRLLQADGSGAEADSAAPEMDGREEAPRVGLFRLIGPWKTIRDVYAAEGERIRAENSADGFSGERVYSLACLRVFWGVAQAAAAAGAFAEALAVASWLRPAVTSSGAVSRATGGVARCDAQAVRVFQLALCAAQGRAAAGQPAFAELLEALKTLDRNPLLLPSSSAIAEIARAFYLSERGCKQQAARILQEQAGLWRAE